MRTSHSEVDDLETLPLGEDVRPQSSTDWNRTPPALPAARLTASFVRIIDVHPARLAGLTSWWSRRAQRGRVRIKRLSLEAVRLDAGGAIRLHGRFRAGLLSHAIPVELTLWPWLGEWTKVTLEPQRHVVMTRRYFRRGHRALAGLEALVGQELGAR